MMSNADEKDAPFYSRLQTTLSYHRDLLRDEARNLVFYEALKRAVTDRTNVLDIGAGSGVWAVAAARLGARRVTAIESDEVMIPLIMNHARENGVADKIEILHGNSQMIELPQRFEVIISETIGNQAFDENITGTLLDARRRFLADGGVMIPQKIALVAAPARLKEAFDLPCGLPFETDYINALTLNLTSNLTDKNSIELLGPACRMLEVDLCATAQEPDFTSLAGRWDLEDVSRAGAIVLWAWSELADGLELDTWHTKSWLPVVLRFAPFAAKRGALELKLNANPAQYRWTLRANDEPPRSYSPFFTYFKFKAQ